MSGNMSDSILDHTSESSRLGQIVRSLNILFLAELQKKNVNLSIKQTADV